jgi:hypothetical protein
MVLVQPSIFMDIREKNLERDIEPELSGSIRSGLNKKN